MYNKLKRLQIMRPVSLMCAIITLGVVASTTTTYAAPSILYRICDRNGAGSCLWAQGSQAKPATPNSKILLKPGTVAYQNEFHTIYFGKVTASASSNWPFTPGKGLNGKPGINGDGVFQIRYAPGGSETGQCAIANGSSGAAVRIVKCSSSTYWVHYGRTWISVRSTNRGGDRQILVLTGSGPHGGTRAIVSPYENSPVQQFIRGRA